MEAQGDFNFVLKCFKRTGLSKSSRSISRLISVYLLFPILLFVYTLVMINFIFHSNNMNEFTEVFESISSFGQLLTRKSIMLFYSSQFDNIIKSRLLFWSYDLFGAKLGDHFRQKNKFWLTGLKVFLTCCFVLLFCFVLTPFFVESVVVPSSCWIPKDNEALRIFIWIAEVLLYLELILECASFDGLFLFMCSDLKIQLSLIIQTLKTIELREICSSRTCRYGEEIFIKMKRCSAHHRLLLRIHAELNKVYSIFFIIQVLLNIVAVTIQFFILTGRSSTITQIVRSLSYIAVIFLQGSLIYFPASNVELEEENLAKTIYNIDWYNGSDNKIKKFIAFWLLNAQKPLQMSGAGLFIINRNIFLQIPRISFSISTILRK